MRTRLLISQDFEKRLHAGRMLQSYGMFCRRLWICPSVRQAGAAGYDNSQNDMIGVFHRAASLQQLGLDYRHSSRTRTGARADFTRLRRIGGDEWSAASVSCSGDRSSNRCNTDAQPLRFSGDVRVSAELFFDIDSLSCEALKSRIIIFRFAR